MLWTALLIGMLGSIHCVAMCGPIAMMLPGDRSRMASWFMGRLQYNLGRTLTYTFLGAIFGLLGQGIVFAGFQQGLSILLGGIMVLSALWFLVGKSKIPQIRLIENALTKLRMQLGARMKKSGPGALFAVGVLNGLLPCGFVYLALAGALSLGSTLDSMAFMAMFGLGTIPLMLVLVLTGDWIQRALRNRFLLIRRSFVVLFGALLILRGLGLGIPYVSPDLPAAPTEQVAGCN